MLTSSLWHCSIDADNRRGLENLNSLIRPNVSLSTGELFKRFPAIQALKKNKPLRSKGTCFLQFATLVPALFANKFSVPKKTAAQTGWAVMV